MGKIIFETERLILREFDFADAEGLIEILSDPLVMKFSSMGPICGEQLKQNLALCINKYKETGAGFWAVIEKASGELIGRIGLPYLEMEGEKFVEVAYRLRRKSWRKGYATEAAKGCVTFAFEALGQSFVRALIDPENASAIKVAMRLGMHFEKISFFHHKPVHVYRLQR